MRIITGKHKGRKLLDCYKLKDLRPTTDRNREGLFNILSSGAFLENFDLRKCDLLDVFSGSGSISFEALSRGLRSATLIDINPDHIELSKNNAKILGEERNCQFINFDLSKPIFQSNQSYNLIFIDPPYHKNLIEGALSNLIKGNFITKDALIIIEYSVYDEVDLSKIKELNLIAEKKYSKTIFNFFSLKA